MLALGANIANRVSGDALYRATYWEWAGAMRRSSPPRERRGGTRPPGIAPGGSFLSARFFRESGARGARFDISSRILRSSPVRLSMPCCEILSSTRFSSSARASRRRGDGVTATVRLAAIALLLATMSSTSSPRSRRGRLRGIARGGSSASGTFATRWRTCSIPVRRPPCAHRCMRR